MSRFEEYDYDEPDYPNAGRTLARERPAGARGQARQEGAGRACAKRSCALPARSA
jgi:hypothetical protein